MKLVLASVTACLIAVTAAVSGYWFAKSHIGTPIPIPTLELLRPKFDQLAAGITPIEAEMQMGAPFSRADHEVFGLGHVELIWKDATGYQYIARFAKGRMYFKSTTRN